MAAWNQVCSLKTCFYSHCLVQCVSTSKIYGKSWLVLSVLLWGGHKILKKERKK